MPDPYRATTGSVNNPADPGSWNRYAYASSDPVNYNDPQGLDACAVGTGERVEFVDCAVLVAFVPNGRGEGANNHDSDYWERQQDRAYGLMNDVFKKALDALNNNTGCQALFRAPDGSPLKDRNGNVLDPSAILNGILNPVDYSTGNVRNVGVTISFDQFSSKYEDTYAFTEGHGYNIGWSGTSATSATMDFNIQWWNKGDVTTSAVVLLHELGHAINFLSPSWSPSSVTGIQNDGYSSAKSLANTDKVLESCFPVPKS